MKITQAISILKLNKLKQFPTICEIRRAYKTLSLKLHPDKTGDADPSKFTELSDAYNFLLSIPLSQQKNFKFEQCKHSARFPKKKWKSNLLRNIQRKYNQRRTKMEKERKKTESEDKKDGKRIEFPHKSYFSTKCFGTADFSDPVLHLPKYKEKRRWNKKRKLTQWARHREKLLHKKMSSLNI